MYRALFTELNCGLLLADLGRKNLLRRVLVKEAFEKGYYEHVSNITADSLEGVFHVGNMGPEENIERFAPMHSLSVGDVVLDENGMYHMVASFGFDAVNELNMEIA